MVFFAPRNVRYEVRSSVQEKRRSPGPLHRGHEFNQPSLFQKCLPRYHDVASYPYWKPITITGEFSFLAQLVRGNQPVTQEGFRRFCQALTSFHEYTHTYTHTYTYTRASKHRRLNLANRFRLDRALFFRRELHWLRRTLITIREDCSNSTSLVPIPDSWPPTLRACCAHREKGLLEGALVPSYFFSSRPPILSRWRNVPQKIAPPGNSVRARARGGNLLRSAFDALFKPYLFPFSPPVQRSNSRGGRDFISAGVSSRFECLRDTFIVPFICDPEKIRENHGRDMDWRNEMRKRAKFLNKRFNLLECNADTSLYNLKIKPCVTTLDAIIFVKKMTHRSVDRKYESQPCRG